MSDAEWDLGRARRALRAAAHRGRQAARLLRWSREPAEFPPPRAANEIPPGAFRHRLYEVQIPLAGPALAEEGLERGKRVNVALAAPAFDGVVVAPWRPLSFWRTLGRPTKAAGFQAGVEILGGCLLPSIGGGLCLLSNALCLMAARLGWTILERHGHSALVATPPAGPALDAMVLWPHRDLRVAPREGPARLAMAVRAGRLHLAVDAARPTALDVELSVVPRTVAGDGARGRLVERQVRERAGGRVLWREVLARDHHPEPAAGPREPRRSCLGCDRQAAGRCATGQAALRRIR